MEKKDRVDNIRLVQKGDKVIVKEETPSQELNSRDVLNSINGIKGEIDKGNDQLNKIAEQKKNLEKGIEVNSKMLKKFEHFEQWAKTIQESKVRAIIEEIKDECQKSVEESYKHDPTLTEEQNKAQKYRQWLHKMATHKKVAEEIANKIMQETFFISPVLENPF